MNQPPFTLRIRTEQDQDMDWMVQPEEITFLQALEVISQVLPQSTITAFEYEDEEGDRITVRSDEEMRAMFETYFSTLSENDMQRGLLPPLIIYPRVGKTPQNRNKFGLKINTHEQSSAKASRPVQTVEHIARNKPVMADLNQPLPNMEPTPLPPSVPVPEISPVNTGTEIAEMDLQLLHSLGSGNGGQVFKGYHKPTDTLMAVKVIRLDVDAKIQTQILSELDNLNKCQSPVIIGFYRAFFVENKIYICTEFMDGENKQEGKFPGGALDKYSPVPEPVLGRMAVFIVQGLMYMWSLKILHRDIKPSNILVNTQGQVKLCDFGVSTQLEKSIANTYVGSNAYMAPERIRGEEYGKPAEVWSLGVCLFELATGRFPFGSHAEKPMQLLNSIVLEETPRLSLENFSPDFVNFVTACMQKEPARRLPTDHLYAHPFIQRHNDGNTSVIASWVQSRLQDLNS